MKLEFIIPGSPNDAFYSQIAFFRASLDHLGGIYEAARVVAVLGDEALAPLPAKWRPYYEHIDIEWADPSDFRQISFFAQGRRRFEVFTSDADLVVLCDADTAVLRPFPSLLSTVASTSRIAAVIAHFSPFGPVPAQSEKRWQEVARTLLGHSIALDYRHTLARGESIHRCPFYFNYGFLAGRPRQLSVLFQRYNEIWPKFVTTYSDWFFSGQIAIALAIADLNLPHIALSMRYNFPNDIRADQLYPNELRNVILLHYLRDTVFDRRRIFTSRGEFDDFLEMDLSGSNRVFGEHVREVAGGTYPFG